MVFSGQRGWTTNFIRSLRSRLLVRRIWRQVSNKKWILRSRFYDWILKWDDDSNFPMNPNPTRNSTLLFRLRLTWKCDNLGCKVYRLCDISKLIHKKKNICWFVNYVSSWPERQFKFINDIKIYVEQKHQFSLDTY